MRLKLEPLSGYLRAEISDRVSAEEARSAVDAILAERERAGATKILVLVRNSTAMFRVESWDLSGYLKRLALVAELRIALASDSRELYASQQYIALLAQQRGVDVSAFPTELAARQWLLQPAPKQA